MEGLVLVAIMGGAVMGWSMFKLLPGMRKQLYVPREWLPTSVYLTSLGWFTFFVPQFIIGQADPFWGVWLSTGIVFTTYMVALVLTLLLCDYRRRRKE
jgi:hypothetical protein